MIQFVTFDDLERINKQVDTRQILNEAAQFRYGKTVFLSHSSKDNVYLPAIIQILENHGGSVYLDLRDDRLPETPSVETAKVLRESLHSCRKFVLFVTTNSKDSRWIPWELGVGDGAKKPCSVAIIPAAKYLWDKDWAGQEFLGLYDRIIWGNFTGQEPEWLVYNHHDNTAVRLREWLSR